MNRELLTCGVRDDREIALTPSDIRGGFAALNKFLAFAGTLDVERFRAALVAAVRLFPCYSGRLTRRGNDYFIRLCDRGIALTIEREERAILGQPPLPTFAVRQPFPKQSSMPVDNDEPLFSVKLTLGRDGFLIGVGNTHVLGDGTAGWLFLRTLAALYSGAPLPPAPDHDRGRLYRAVFAIADATVPDFEVPIMSKLQFAGFIGKCVLGDMRARCISYEIHFDDLAAAAGASRHDAIAATVARDIALASKHADIGIGSVYSARRFAELDIDDRYVGNAVCARVTTLPRARWVDDAHGSAAALRATREQLTPGGLAAEYRFFHRQQALGTLPRFLPDFMSCLFEGGAMINDCSKFPMYACTLDGAAPLWAYTQPPALPRYASIFPAADGAGVVVHLKMPKAEIARLLAVDPARRSFRDYVDA